MPGGRQAGNGSDWPGLPVCSYDPRKQDILAEGILTLEKIMSEVLFVNSSIWNDEDLVLDSLNR